MFTHTVKREPVTMKMQSNPLAICYREAEQIDILYFNPKNNITIYLLKSLLVLGLGIHWAVLLSEIAVSHSLGPPVERA